jgi:hypothetical protein
LIQLAARGLLIGFEDLSGGGVDGLNTHGLLLLELARPPRGGPLLFYVMFPPWSQFHKRAVGGLRRRHMSPVDWEILTGRALRAEGGDEAADTNP